MNKLFITLVTGLTLGTALPTWGGPDWQAIEQARKAKQAQQISRRGDAVAVKCEQDTAVPQLDHGPRAQTTPSQNQARKERDEAQVKACKAAAR